MEMQLILVTLVFLYFVFRFTLLTENSGDLALSDFSHLYFLRSSYAKLANLLGIGVNHHRILRQGYPPDRGCILRCVTDHLFSAPAQSLTPRWSVWCG